MDAIGVKKYRKCLAALQHIIKCKKRVIRDEENLRLRMKVGNPHTDFGRGYFAGYNAAMNDILLCLSQEIDVAESSWNGIDIRSKTMTLKEKIAETNPEAIDDNEIGGVKNCPHCYLNIPIFEKCVITPLLDEKLCEECWNKEFAEAINRRWFK